MDTSLPRPEYPRPQFVRTDWLNLNGPWKLRIDDQTTAMTNILPNSVTTDTSWISQFGVLAAKWRLYAVAIGPSGLCGATATPYVSASAAIRFISEIPPQ